ncbi:hypothetical protein JCM8097_004716 [Rhodosporidiobolus ruineniae]
MVRISTAALGLAAFTACASAAAAPALGSTVADSQCETYTNGKGFNVLCGPIFDVAGTLLYQGNSVTTNADKILNTLQGALGGDSGAVGSITSAVTNGLVSNLAYGVSAILGGAATVLENANPQCKCDLSLCLANLRDAAQATSVPTDTAQASCAQAKYACAAYYSNSDLYQVAPGCAAYEGTTGQSSSKRARRAITFDLE